jgi:hypothetical protein
MKKGFITFLSSVFLLIFLGAAFAADVAITSVGQSPDGMMVKVLMRRLNIEPDYDALMEPGALKNQKALIAVIGGSSKGLGAAGIDKEQEKTRAVGLINEAKKKNVKILVMHVGGEGRRGDLSDMFINEVAGLGDLVIVVKSGNADGIFGKMKAASAQLIEIENIQAAVTPLEAAFKEWGVAK